MSVSDSLTKDNGLLIVKALVVSSKEFAADHRFAAALEAICGGYPHLLDIATR